MRLARTRGSNYPTLYGKLIEQRGGPHEEAIVRDIKRTFTKHQYFSDSCVLGQQELLQVLRAYAAYDNEVGYCQGMGFITATFLCYLSPEDAFWLLSSIMERQEFNMRELFRPGMPKFRRTMDMFSRMLEQTEPELSRHFSEIGIKPEMYASQWVMTLFAYNFPLRFVVRVFDLFMAQGWSIVFRVGLVLLSNERGILTNLSFEQVMLHLRDIPNSVDLEQVFPKAISLHLPEAMPDMVL